ncbi:MAG: UbiH/UbiF family hydroxylase [Rhodobacteraceae bacterium]|nr:UbiH/UbiF family hydroxylase [Paracoccaceae bacterium]
MSAPTREILDVIVSGGGIAGLTLAAAFGTAGFRVLCVDPAPPVTAEGEEGADLRSTAFLQPARALLERAGLWDRLAPHATPLEVMRIIDAGGETTAPRYTADFDAADLSEAPFGWNFPNWLLRRETAARLGELPGVEFRPGTATAGVVTREGEALVTLSDGTRAAARLLVAADGRSSPVRQALGIGVTTWRYGQKALAFAVTHPIPHGNVSTEIHRAGGPFTLVPLPDRGGLPCSAVVWMERGPEALRLAGLPAGEFEAAMSERSGHVLGPLTLVTRRSVWPIVSQIADRFAGQRTALVAEAAHVVPPIGAQGLNMSLADTACLLDLAVAAGDGLGDGPMLMAYHRRRWPEARARLAGIDLLNRAAMAGAPAWRDLRGQALRLAHGLAPVRRALMRAGLGVG